MSRSLVAAVSAMIVASFAACSSRTDTQTFGNFRIETWQTEAFGHTGHSFKVFHVHSWRSHEIADNVAYFLDPNSPDRILVRGCLNMSDESSCALRYFNGATDKTHVISNDPDIRNGSQLHWSPGGRFLAVVAQLGFMMVNLENGSVFDAGSQLDLHLPERDIGYFQIEWSPDGTVAAIDVQNRVTPPPSAIEVDVFTIDGAASTIRYIASLPPKSASDGAFEWQERSGRYELVASPEPPVFRKRQFEIPAGVIY